MPRTEGDRVEYRDGRTEMQRGRIEEVRDEGPHATYRIRNEGTQEIQVVTDEQVERELD